MSKCRINECLISVQKRRSISMEFIYQRWEGDSE